MHCLSPPSVLSLALYNPCPPVQSSVLLQLPQSRVASESAKDSLYFPICSLTQQRFVLLSDFFMEYSHFKGLYITFQLYSFFKRRLSKGFTTLDFLVRRLFLLLFNIFFQRISLRLQKGFPFDYEIRQRFVFIFSMQRTISFILVLVNHF